MAHQRRTLTTMVVLLISFFAFCSCMPLLSTANYKVDFNKLEELYEYPKQVFEHSGLASGSFKGKADRDSLDEVSEFHSVLVFNKADINSHLMTTKCKKKLQILARYVLESLEKKCLLFVEKSFIDKLPFYLSKVSLHMEGRALDIRLVNSSRNKDGKLNCTKQQLKLANLAAKRANFNYVHARNKLVHVSCSV